jgi:hypothetical protein
MKAKHKTKKTNGQKYMEALAVLEARITELEKNTPLFQSVAKLGIKKKDVLLITTQQIIPAATQQRITDEIGRHVGFSAAVVFMTNDCKTEVLHAEPE